MGKSPTVGAFILAWLKDSAQPKVRPMTYRGYEQLARIHLIPALGNLCLDKLTPTAIQAFQNRMSESGKAPATVRYARAVLRVALRQAVRWGLIVRNPVDLVDGPKV